MGAKAKWESGPKRWKILKMVGKATAVISLLLALNQVTGLVQEFRIHHREFWDAMKTGREQVEREDYAAAYESFKRASELDPIDRDALDMEADAAMLWLENIYYIQEGQHFSDIVNPLLPVLYRARGHSTGPKAADLLAHIGWANFLRSRDFRSRRGAMPAGVSVEPNYQDALRLDPNNPYAHAMWGHWILWEYGELNAALAHFSAALRSGRARPFVRHLQLCSLYNSDGADMHRELFRVANEMRKNQESITRGDRSRAFDESIEFRLDHQSELLQILNVVPRSEAEATYDWLSQGYEVQDEPFKSLRREFITATLVEIEGKNGEAMSRYQSLLTRARKANQTSVIDLANDSLTRLSPSAIN